MLAGESERSIRRYARSLALNPDNDHAATMIERLRSGNASAY